MRCLVRKTICTAFLFLPTILFGQSYFDNNPIWEIQSGCALYPCNPMCVEYSNYNYFFNGDTVINTHNYKKLYSKGSVWHQCNTCSPVPQCCQSSYTFYDTTNVIVFLRDTLKQIYLLDTAGNPEVLLYDFDLSIGDTLPVNIIHWNAGNILTVVSIDSILIGNDYRKKFNLNNGPSAGFLIEGVGHEWGFIEPLDIPLECGWNLLCFGLGDTAYYPALGATCNNGVGVEDIIKPDNKINIVPNPSPGNFTIFFKKNINSGEIEIINVLGEEIFSVSIFNASKEEINLKNISAGIYFVRIFDGEKYFSEKVIIDKE